MAKQLEKFANKVKALQDDNEKLKATAASGKKRKLVHQDSFSYVEDESNLEIRNWDELNLSKEAIAEIMKLFIQLDIHSTQAVGLANFKDLPEDGDFFKLLVAADTAGDGDGSIDPTEMVWGVTKYVLQRDETNLQAELVKQLAKDVEDQDKFTFEGGESI